MTIDEIRQRADFHFRLADSQRKSSAFFATLFTWGIPTLAALVSAFVTKDYMVGEFNLDRTALWLSLLLTLMTLANAKAKPSEDFRTACAFASAFWAFRRKFDIGIERLDAGEGEAQDTFDRRYLFLEQQVAELEDLIARFNGAFVPAKPVTN